MYNINLSKIEKNYNNGIARVKNELKKEYINYTASKMFKMILWTVANSIKYTEVGYIDKIINSNTTITINNKEYNDIIKYMEYYISPLQYDLYSTMIWYTISDDNDSYVTMYITYNSDKIDNQIVKFEIID